MTPFRFAVLVAVSSEDQATEDKDSLEHQYKAARAFGERWGGTFTRDYRAEGFSRSGWYDLTPVLNTCKGFGDLARDARAHAFDVVIVEDYDRLGDIGMMLFNYFADQGAPYIQMISVQKRIMIEDPALYHPRRDNAITDALADALAHNKKRTNKVFRAFEVGNSRRARDGKYAMRVTRGYLRTESKEAVIDPELAPIIAKFPDWFLSGCTLSEMVRRAERATDTRWSHAAMIYILENPFYAGKTFYDRKHGGELYDGKHEPLWSWDTYLRIQAELRRRRETRANPRKTFYNFTSLLTCSECGLHLKISYSSLTPHLKYWLCLNGHVSVSAKIANKAVADELKRLFANKARAPEPKETAKDFTAKQLRQVDYEFKRLEDAYYKTGAYTAEEFAARKKTLDERRKELQDEQYQAEEAKRRSETRVEAFTTIAELLPHMEEYITEREPARVNYLLRQVIAVKVRPNKSFRAELIY